MYDSRIGRRWEIDPVFYHWQSPYAAFNNNPIYFADPSGLEGEDVSGDKKGEVLKDEKGNVLKDENGQELRASFDSFEVKEKRLSKPMVRYYNMKQDNDGSFVPFNKFVYHKPHTSFQVIGASVKNKMIFGQLSLGARFFIMGNHGTIADGKTFIVLDQSFQATLAMPNLNGAISYGWGEMIMSSYLDDPLEIIINAEEKTYYNITLPIPGGRGATITFYQVKGNAGIDKTFIYNCIVIGKGGKGLIDTPTMNKLKKQRKKSINIC